MSAADPGTPFTEPWQARVFALVGSLRDAGVLEAGEWSRALGGRLAGLAPDCRDPDAIWACWVAALEERLIGRGIAGPLQLTSLRQSWALAAEKTPHGQAVTLGAAAHRLAGLGQSASASAPASASGAASASRAASASVAASASAAAAVVQPPAAPGRAALDTGPDQSRNSVATSRTSAGPR